MKDIASPSTSGDVAHDAPRPKDAGNGVQALLARGGMLAVFVTKLGKLGLTAGSMVVSIGAYSLIYGWRYAVGFVALIFVHEMGHFLAAREKGLTVGAPTFIPFFGAWVALKDMPLNAETEAYIGLAGPVAGTVGAIACYSLAGILDSPMLLALSYSGFFLNLFNLIPVSPFDGGRITSVLSPRVWLIGVPIMVALFLYQHSPMLIVMGILAAPQLLAAFRYDPRHPDHARYYATSLKTKLIYGGLYLGLVGFLALASFEVHNLLAQR